MRLLVVTNDFPPGIGGIEDYVARLLHHLPASTTAVVLAPPHPGAPAYDRQFRHDVRRWQRWPMLPTPGLSRRVVQLVRQERPDVLVFGAAMPLALMAGMVQRASGVPVVAFTHGVEPALAAVPGGGVALRSIARHAAAMTAVSRWAESRLRSALGPQAWIELLPSGIDAERFHPGVSGEGVRMRHGLADRRIVVCVSRLVRRKGQDQLIRALPGIARQHADVRLVVVGGGPDRRRLDDLARSAGVSERVVFTGPVPYDDLPGYLAAGDVFAMPCRARLGGLDTEALGAVFLQAAGVGRAAVAGSAGGAPEAVLHERTGLVVDGWSTSDVAAAISRLLSCPDDARLLGARAARRVHQELTWTQMALRLESLLRRVAAGRRGP